MKKSKELRIKERYLEIIDGYKLSIGKALYKNLVDDYLIEITSRTTDEGDQMVVSIRNNDNVDQPIPLYLIEDRNLDRYKGNSYLECLFQAINSMERRRINQNAEGEVLTLDIDTLLSQNVLNYKTVSTVEPEIPKKGNCKIYRIVGYLYDKYLIEPAPIHNFNPERLLVDIQFERPLNGEFNIYYPFHDFQFEGIVTNAISLGDVLKQISEAYEFVYELAVNIGIEYFFEIDDLTFDDDIRIFENGTIEFHVLS